MTKRQIERCIKIYDKNKSSYQKLTMMAFLFESDEWLIHLFVVIYTDLIFIYFTY